MKIVERQQQVGTVRAMKMPFAGTLIVRPASGAQSIVFEFDAHSYVILDRNDWPTDVMCVRDFDDAYPLKVEETAA